MTSRKFTFTVAYEFDPETGCYCAGVPALNLASQGETLEEARRMIREALELHLEGMLEEGIPIPADVLEVERVTVEVPASDAETATP
jgi:predicted RNase H-like HicB family nuclease